MRAALIALAIALSACAELTEQALFSVSGGESPSPEFGVSALTGGQMPANYAAFNRIDAGVADFHASQICTLGYDKGEPRTLAFDPGEVTWWRIRCAPYHLAVF